MRRPLCSMLLLTALLSGCSGDGDPEESPSPEPTIEGVERFSELSQKHLGKGEYDITYPQSPPVGGAHSQVWLKCQSYTAELPKVNVVHSLEHGGVWLTYLPGTSAADVTTLETYTGLNREYVIVSPYAGQDAPVIATAWGRQLRLQKADDPRIQQFVRAYAGNGPEKRVTCASSGASLEQALEYDAKQQ